jgi:hypothetical protein
MTRYLEFDVARLLQPPEQKIKSLLERLAEAHSELTTAPPEERVQELAKEIEAIELAWNEENQQ